MNDLNIFKDDWECSLGCHACELDHYNQGAYLPLTCENVIRALPPKQEWECQSGCPVCFSDFLECDGWNDVVTCENMLRQLKGDEPTSIKNLNSKSLHQFGDGQVLSLSVRVNVTTHSRYNVLHEVHEAVHIHHLNSTLHPPGGGRSRKQRHKKITKSLRTYHESNPDPRNQSNPPFLHHDHSRFKRYKNKVSDIEQQIAVLTVQLSHTTNSGEITNLSRRVSVLHERLEYAKVVNNQINARAAAWTRRNDQRRKSNCNADQPDDDGNQSTSELIDDFIQWADDELMKDQNAAHDVLNVAASSSDDVLYAASKHLHSTNNWFKDKADGYYHSALRSRVGVSELTTEAKRALRLEIDKYLLYLLRSRKSAGPLLNNAMYRLEVLCEKAHLRIQTDTEISTPEEREEFYKLFYGKQKCHHRRHETFGEDYSNCKYYTREQFATAIVDTLDEDGIDIDEPSTSAAHTATTSGTYRHCDHKCDIAANWGTKLHNLLEVFQPSGVSFMKLLAIVKSFTTCDNCDNVSYENCPVSECTDKIKFIRHLLPHYDGIRSLSRDIYKVTGIANKIQKINQCLEGSDYTALLNVVESVDFGVDHNVQSVVDAVFQERDALHCLESVNAQFGSNRKLFDIAVGEASFPNHDCKLCHRLRRKSQMHASKQDFESLRNLGDIGKDVAKLLEDDSIVPDKYMLCIDCWDAARKNKIPCFTKLNNFYLHPLPPELRCLSMYELMLVTKVRSIKKIIHLHTMSRKGNNLVYGVRGNVMHLPMPTEPSLEYVINQLPSMDRMSFILRSIPNETLKVIKEHLINFDNVLRAAEWLIRNNVLYRDTRVLVDKPGLMKQLDDAFITLEGGNTEFYDGMPVAPNVANLDRLDEESIAQHSEHYSMVPVNMSDATRESFKDVMEYSRVTADAVYSNHAYVDMLSYVAVYPYGTNGLRDPTRPRPIPQRSFYEALLSQVDPRVRLDKDFIVDSMLRKQQDAIGNSIWRVLQTGSFGHMNCDQLLNFVAAGDKDFNFNVNQIQANNRGSAAYWNDENKKLRAMDRAYGPASLFVTLSCAEYRWQDLDKYLRHMNSHLENISTIPLDKLCSIDPVSVATHFQKRFDAIMSSHIAPGLYNKRKKEPTEGVFGIVEHYYYRLEYQARGAPHVHMKLWVRDAPILGKDACEDIIKWVQERITCRLPDEHMEKELYTLVHKFQTHTCKPAYCSRHSKSKNGQFSTYCRAGFGKAGRSTVEKAKLLSVDTVIKARRKNPKNIAQILRNEKERHINDYNPALLLAWGANMDVQYIGEKSSVLNHYITGYITKHEQGVAADLLDNIDRTGRSVSSILRSIANQMNRCREVGIYEAVVKLLGLPYCGSDQTVDVISLGVPTERHGKLRSKEFLADARNAGKSVIHANLINNYYPNRPDELETISLHDARTKWNVTRERPSSFVDPDDLQERGDVQSDSDDDMVAATTILLPSYRFTYPFDGFENNVAYFVKKSNPSICRYNQRSTKTEQDRLRYYHDLLQLYKPWRYELELKGSFPSYYEAFIDAMENLPDLVAVHNHREFIESEIAQAKRWEEEALETAEIDAVEDEIQDMRSVQERVDERRTELIGNIDTSMSFAQIAGSLNTTQLRIYNSIMETIDHFDTVHNNGPCDCTPRFLPIRKFVSGVAGVGKSHLIKALVCTLHKKYSGAIMNQCFPAVAVVAPTGLSAWNVDGVTAHRYFNLNVAHNSIEPPLRKLQSEDVKMFREVCKNVRLIIFDEISMISNVTFAKIEQRLSTIFPVPIDDDSPDNCQLFGGRSMLLIGDLLQLPPVSKTRKIPHIYKPFRRNDPVIQRALGVTGLPPLWNHFEYEELTENMRQRTGVLAEILGRVRIGIPSQEDIDTLMERKIPCDSNNLEEVAKLFQVAFHNDHTSVALYGKTADVEAFNKIMLRLESVTLVAIDAVDNVRLVFGEPRPKKRKPDPNLKTSDTAGLQTIFEVGVGARVMLRRNLDTPSGMVNGALGIVTKLNFKDDNPSDVDSILVKFDSIEEPKLIRRFQADYERAKDKFTQRSQFPLIISYAMTIHKSQGLTLGSIYIQLGRDIHSNSMCYVALSRTRRIEDIHLIDFNPSLIQCDRESAKEYNRLRATYNESHPDEPELQPFGIINLLPARYERQKFAAKVRPPEFTEMVDGARKPARKAKSRKAATTASESAVGHSSQALVFSNVLSESCYANAVAQLMLSSPMMAQIMQGGPHDLHANAVLRQFQQLVVHNNRPPRRKVSVDSLRTAVHAQYAVGTGTHSSLEFMSDLLGHFIMNKRQWMVRVQVLSQFPCHEHPKMTVEWVDALQFDSRPVNGTISWNQLIANRFSNEVETERMYCETCHGEEAISAFKAPFMYDTATGPKLNSNAFQEWMCANHGVEVMITTTRTIDDDCRFILVQLPLRKYVAQADGSIASVWIDSLVTEVPANNDYTFPQLFPGVSFAVRGAICSHPGHYWACVDKDGHWFSLNDVAPHVTEVDGLPNGLHQVAVLLLEKK